MRNLLKVARWEIKRNLKNRSFLIGLFITPAILFGFMLLGNVFDDSDHREDPTVVYVHDKLGIFDHIRKTVDQHQLNWKMKETDIREAEVETKLKSEERTAYIFLDDRALEEGLIPVYTSEEMEPAFMQQIHVLEFPIQTMKMEQLGLSAEEQAAMSQKVHFKESTAAEEEGTAMGEDPLKRALPGGFAGILLLSIVFSGMYIFQSASQEKKDKIAEIILSSVTPGELMQGKILGYFVLGILQAVTILGFAVPMANWKLDIPILEYLLVPEILLYVLIAVLGYLLFSALYVGVGASMADITSTNNFQGMVMMLPFLPFIFISPVIRDPSGLIAQIGTFIPFTSPGVLLLRLSILEEWPWIEIFIALAVLSVSIYIFMKLAGKIFKTGILMYGKNATPKEIWRWIRT